MPRQAPKHALSVRDFLQIAGRAGRKGYDDRGTVICQAPEHVVENRIAQTKAAGDPKKTKKLVLKKPPEKGYAHWDATTFERLRTSLPEKLESRFTINHGLIVNLLQAYEGASSSGYRRLVELVQLSHTSEGTRARLLKHARALVQSLLGAGLVIHEKRSATAPALLRVAQGLQHNFSLNHTLSLYLVETLAMLEQAKESWPLDVLSLVESILENPDVVLWAQVDAAKDAKVRELKAQGVEYEQRMEELEKVTYPKPNEELIYGTFDEFAKKHPWVQHDNVRPKSVARDVFERCMTFNEYVKEYGLQRSEGVLLRYLSDAYKTLIQNVPEGVRTEQLEDIAAYLLTTIKHTDSSLLEEWESLKENRALGVVARPGEEAPRPKKDLAKDVKALTARVRAELHQVVKLLAKKDYDELVELQAEWTVEKYETAMAPYWAERQTIDTTPRARQPKWTVLTPDGPRRWTVRQSLLDLEGEPDWFIEGLVDLSEREDVDGALVTVRHVGR